MRRLATSAALALAAAVLAVSADASARTQCQLQDASITESSGLAALDGGRWLLTHNDSGDVARFFVVRATDCITVATHTLVDGRGAAVEPRDIEAMATGPKGSVWLADIGDNNVVRDDIAIYRAPGTTIDANRAGTEVKRTGWQRYRLAYEDGAHDAEAVLVHPRSGRVHVVTKEWFGGAAVYRAPARLATGRVNLLRRVATIDLPAALGLPSVTDGALSPSGKRLVLRTYTHAYVWELGRGGVAAAARGTPRRMLLPAQEQGESIAWASEHTIVVTSEGKHPEVHHLWVGR